MPTSRDFEIAQKRLLKGLSGDGPVEKHIILLKLTDLFENIPDFGEEHISDVQSPQLQWVARAGALLRRLSAEYKVNFDLSADRMHQIYCWQDGANAIKRQVAQAIEEIKLELELDGRSEIGTAYSPGEVYKFYSDLKTIADSAQLEIFVIDPYFDGKAFDEYLAHVSPSVSVRILTTRYIRELLPYVEKHKAEFSSDVRLAKSDGIHDRILIIDRDVAWVMGGSIKDAGKKPTYLIPLPPPIAGKKLEIYEAIWNEAQGTK